MNVAGHRAPRQPLARGSRRRQLCWMQQHQDLSRFAARWTFGEARLLNRMHGWRLRGVSDQE